jgi:quercetin dioxygenase-like cupin family protein
MMKIHDLDDMIAFSPGKPVKRHFLNAKGFHAAIICIQKGGEIPPHPEDYGVFFTVTQGRGVFTQDGENTTIGRHQGIYVKKGEARGIKALEDLVVLGIQDRP